MRIGVMTGGGDCPGLNAAIRAVTRVATYQHGFDVVGIRDGFLGLIENRWRSLTDGDVRGVLRIGGTMLGASNRTNPFSFRQAAGGDVIDASERAFATVQDLGIDALIVIGGDGTLLLSNRFSQQYGVPVIGVPKTIDNDVHGTDYAIGFDSAVTYVADAIDRLHTTAESHHRVMLLEAMGRTTGWIALHAGVAGGADVVLIPEQPFELSGIVDTIERRKAQDRLFTIIVVAEGITAPGGELIYRSKDGAEHEWKLGGVCESLAGMLAEHTSQDVRSIVLGHLQRGGSPTAFDRTLATQLGAQAVELVAGGHSSLIVGMHGATVSSAPLEEAAHGPKTVPVDHPLLRAARGMGVYVG